MEHGQKLPPQLNWRLRNLFETSRDLTKIHAKGKRKKINKNEPRTCDIDIIDYDQKIIRNNNNQILTLPHPKMHVRTFVLLPLFEITQQWIHPEKKIEIKKLINSLNIKDLRTIKQI
mgnify:CR=1 FL=1